MAITKDGTSWLLDETNLNFRLTSPLILFLKQEFLFSSADRFFLSSVVSMRFYWSRAEQEKRRVCLSKNEIILNQGCHFVRTFLPKCQENCWVFSNVRKMSGIFYVLSGDIPYFMFLCSMWKKSRL